MAIRYYVRKSKLSGKNINIGRVDLKGSFDREMVIDRMLDMGSGITKADILGVLTNFEKALKTICLEGNKVTLEGFMQFTPTLSGTFDSESDGFDSTKNEVYVTAQVSRVFNDDFGQKAVVEKIAVDLKKPMLVEIINVATKEANLTVSVNCIVSISGEYLKFDETSPDEYLKFVNANNTTESVKITQIQKLTDKEIVFLMPDTAILEGYFEVASKQDTNTVRVGRTLYNLAVKKPVAK